MGGMGGAGDAGYRGGMGGFNWQYNTTIDPEDLFRKIFGNAGFHSSFDDFAESKFGMGASQEVLNLLF
jgi:DnaJ family protein A protein 3